MTTASHSKHRPSRGVASVGDAAQTLARTRSHVSRQMRPELRKARSRLTNTGAAKLRAKPIMGNVANLAASEAGERRPSAHDGGERQQWNYGVVRRFCRTIRSSRARPPTRGRLGSRQIIRRPMFVGQAGLPASLRASRDLAARRCVTPRPAALGQADRGCRRPGD